MALPGSPSHAAAKSASKEGATRLRRRLSKIFQRLISGKVLRAVPSRVFTRKNNQPSSCQSPRTQRWARRAWASTLEG